APIPGGVLTAINVRLDPATVAFILAHCEAKVLLTDRELSRTIAPALASLERRPLVIDIVDDSVEGGELLGAMDYEAFLATGDPHFPWRGPADEWQAIALNYTSGTTGHPKGVVYHHRGAYLTALSNVLMWDMPANPIFLWTLPMFHCNGWCFPWTLALLAGTSVCLRAVRVEPIFDLIKAEKVTHLCGAPIVLGTMGKASVELTEGLPPGVKVLTGGAPPPPSVIERMEQMGFEVTHGYGLTESYGPALVCTWPGGDDSDDMPLAERARLKARQGTRVPMLDEMMVADPETLRPVARDGETLGEVFLRGNTVMKGYFKHPTGTEEG